MNKNFIKLVLALFFLFSIFTITYSQSKKKYPKAEKAALATRMAERKNTIRILKSIGKIGEENGLLAFVSKSSAGPTVIEPTTESNTPLSLSDEEVNAVIEEENGDRTQLYNITSGETNCTPEDAAVTANAMYFKDAAPTDLFKTSDGRWLPKQEINSAQLNTRDAQ